MARSIAAALVIVTIATAFADAQTTVGVEWSPNTDPYTAGYRLDWGTAPGTYQWSLDTGTQTRADVTLTPGTYYFVIRAYNIVHAHGPASDEVAFTLAGNEAPTVVITAPADGTTVPAGTPITFAGTATDEQAGDLTASLQWSSGLSGPIGTGGSGSVVLPAGTHVVEASVTDAGGQRGSASVTVVVVPGSGVMESVLTSLGSDDGFIVESSHGSESGGIVDSTSSSVVALRIGDLNGRQQLRSVLSFDTSSIPDEATVLSATLRLQRGTLRGSDPFLTHGAALVDIRRGAFGGNRLLEADDFAAEPSVAGVAALSRPAADGDWAEATFNAAGLAAIDTTGLTQLRLAFALGDDGDHTADFVGFRSGDDNDPASRPHLIVRYSSGGGAANTAPTVAITGPVSGSTFAQGTPIPFTGTATDDGDGDLTTSLTWISSLDGPIGGGGSPVAVLTPGTHTVTAAVTDTGMLTGSASITVTVLGNTPPAVAIASPANGSTVVEGTALSFAGTAEDIESGSLTAGLEWHSSLDGPIGYGGAFSAVLSPGTHTVTASVTDGDLPGSASIVVTVNPVGGTTERTFTSIGAEDGLVVESSEHSDRGGYLNGSSGNAMALRMGDNNGNQQQKTILSFDTSSIPDGATIVSAIVRLRSGAVRGSNPFLTHGVARVDVRTGGFGSSRALAREDFEAPPTAAGVAALSSPAADGDWSEGSLNAAGLAAINTTGVTQLRLYFALDDNDDGVADFVGFRSGNDADADSRPQLIVVYQP